MPKWHELPCEKVECGSRQDKCEVLIKDRWDVRAANYATILGLLIPMLLIGGILGLAVIENNKEMKRLRADYTALRSEYRGFVERTMNIMQEQIRINERVLSGERL